jgi:uncharacterized membrane protein YphA (DoxX/SURF4 family)
MALRKALSGLRVVLAGHNLNSIMRLVSSTFADRLPSIGLLLLRAIVAIALVVRCLQLDKGGSLHTFTPHLIAAGAGLFLLLGLWTPAAGVILAITEILIAFSQGHDPWASVVLGSLGVAVALLGPGTWSLDARRSGWKRIEIRPSDN